MSRAGSYYKLRPLSGKRMARKVLYGLWKKVNASIFFAEQKGKTPAHALDRKYVLNWLARTVSKQK